MLLAHIAWLGTVPAWLTLATLVAVALAVRGGAMGPAIGYLREANQTLERENQDLKAKLAVERKENAALHATRDLEPMAAAIAAEVARHELASAARDAEMLTALKLVVQRLEKLNGVEHVG